MATTTAGASKLQEVDKYLCWAALHNHMATSTSMLPAALPETQSCLLHEQSVCTIRCHVSITTNSASYALSDMHNMSYGLQLPAAMLVMNLLFRESISTGSLQGKVGESDQAFS